MTRETIQKCIDLLNTDGINSKEQVKKILQGELVTIDNANPSEALECLEKLKGMEISSMPFSDEYGTQEVDLNDIRKVGSQLNTDFREYINTIKQALLKAQEPKQYLKAQEPKHYLKWEDLEFGKTPHKLKCKMNDSLYRIEWFIDGGGFKAVNIYLYVTKDYLEFCTACNEQFFNDLRLERVEE